MSSNNSQQQPRKLKILLFGSIGEECGAFVSKLQALHNSKAGPFDAAFCVGAVSATKLMQHIRSNNVMPPLPVYLQDPVESIEDELLPMVQAYRDEQNNNKKPSGDDEEDMTTKTNHEDPESSSSSSQLLQLHEHIFVLRNAQPPHRPTVWSLPLGKFRENELVVAACPHHVRVESEAAQELLQAVQHVSYRGCDLLLSTEWPQGVETLLKTSNKATHNNISFDVAHVALQARARYHVAAANTTTQEFVQSPPFQHLAATTNTAAIRHTGRFVALGSVVETAALQQRSGGAKATKFVHALGLKPLLQMAPHELDKDSSSTPPLPCPYTDASYQTDDKKDPGASTSGKRSANHPSSSSSGGGGGLSEASARRILAEERSKATGGSIGAQRWATKRRRGGEGQNQDGQHQQQTDDQEIDPDNVTLFVHGLHKDVTGLLQSSKGDAVLLQTFAAKFQAVRVRKPPNAPTSSFCFVDFPNHAQALACWNEWHASGVTVSGVDLEVRWATHHNKKNKRKGDAEGHPSKKPRLTEAEARDSSTVYFKLPAEMMTNKGNDLETLGEALRTWMERTLEDALAPEDDGDGGERVTAADEPALRVQKSLPTATDDEGQHDANDANYGFLEFASHAAASMALATLTGSTDGGLILSDAPRLPGSEYEGVRLHWGHGKKNQNEKDVIEDASGFKFERKHFPADSRQDCWFCLASESCEKHLITGVYDSCYSAMPKGPVHEGHVLLIPVQHTGQGALKDTQVANEMEQLKAKLCQHALEAYDRDMFVFERAIQTKGGYHTHVQCIPVPRQVGIKLQATMLAQARKIGMDLREITSDLGVAALLSSSSDGNENAGYFYAEIIMGGSSSRRTKRFLHKATDTTASVPLQFGREVLAAVLGQPELAHWKSCVASKEDETKLAANLREALSS